MTAERMYALSNDAIAAQLDGEAVLLHLATRRYFRLNETAAEVWTALERGVSTPDALTAWLCERFAVESRVAGEEVARLLGELEACDLVQAVAAS